MRISKMGYTGQTSIVMKVFMLAGFSLLAAVSFFSDTYAADSFYRNFDTRYGRADVQPICQKVSNIVANGTGTLPDGNVYVTYGYTLQGNDNARWIEYPSRRIDPSGATHYIQEPGSIISSLMPRQSSGGYTINPCSAYTSPGRDDGKIWEADGKIDLNSDEFANRFAARFGDRIEDYTYVGMNVGHAPGVGNYFGNFWCS